MARLQAPVAREAAEISALLTYFMKVFKDRQNREQLTPKRGSDIFLVIGEWPVVVEECPEAVDKVSRLLRQARQYGIHVVAEYQDALVKTIGGSSGTRANYGTVYFAGGDPTTARALLRPPEGMKLNLNGLGKEGAVYLRSHSNAVITGRVPFFSNQALYMLLGFPEDPVTDDIVDEDDFYDEDTEESIDEIFSSMPDIRSEDGDMDDDDEDYPFTPSRPAQTPEPLSPSSSDKKRPWIKIGTDLTTKKDVLISTEQFDMLVNMRRHGVLRGYRQIPKILPVTETHAKNLNKLILKELGVSESESEGECEIV